MSIIYSQGKIRRTQDELLKVQVKFNSVNYKKIRNTNEFEHNMGAHPGSQVYLELFAL